MLIVSNCRAMEILSMPRDKGREKAKNPPVSFLFSCALNAECLTLYTAVLFPEGTRRASLESSSTLKTSTILGM